MLLLIDNYDSFTYNIYNAFCTLGAHIEICLNDACRMDDIAAAKPLGVIIGPGPGSPSGAGASLDAIKLCIENRIPIFGICLGHQAIGEYFGSQVIRADKPMHGKVSPIYHNGKGIFRDLPQGIKMARYHSLVVDTALPDCFDVTAKSEDGLIMGLIHKELPIQGVQFHPESAASEGGLDLLRSAYLWMLERNN